MKKTLSIICVLFVSAVFLSGCSGIGPSPEYATFERQVKTEIFKMVELLRADRVQEFVELYVDLNYIKEKGGVSQVMGEFEGEGKVALTGYLERAEGMSPFVDSKNLQVTFDGPAFPRPLVFKKELGRWRLLNN